MNIGVISDTHNFLDRRLPELFAGVEHILHAGDIGQPWLIAELEHIAPVTYVSGNTDEPGCFLRPWANVELGGHRFLLHHIVDPRSPPEALRASIARERPAAVIFGHTHRPFSQVLEGVLFFNPGYAGRRRFAQPRSVAILHCGPAGIQPEYLPL